MAVLPGVQPFEYNWLSFLYVSFVAMAFSVYVVATVPIWPLMFLFSLIILPTVFGIVFFFMHVPVEIMRGRASFCCRCRLWCYDKDDLIYMDEKELDGLATLLPDGVDRIGFTNNTGEAEKRKYFSKFTDGWPSTHIAHSV